MRELEWIGPVGRVAILRLNGLQLFSQGIDLLDRGDRDHAIAAIVLEMLDIGYAFHQRLLIFDHLTLELLQMLIDAIEPAVHLR